MREGDRGTILAIRFESIRHLSELRRGDGDTVLSCHKVSRLPTFWLGYRRGGFLRNIASFLDLPDVRKTLGIASHIGNFTSCSSDIGMDFGKHLDHLQLTKYYVEGLLERGIRVLVYVGTYDWIWFVLFPHTPLTKVF